MSKCDKDMYIFNRQDWDIRVTSSGDSTRPQCYIINEIEITKKKPKAELKWSPIIFASDKTMQEAVGDYRLVQFRLDYGGLCYNLKHQTCALCLNWYGDITYFYLGEVMINGDAYNKWSAPVVVPIDFYDKLDCHVAEFNKELNK